MSKKNIAKIKKESSVRNYYKNCYKEFSKPIVDTFVEFSLEDCIKYLIVKNVKSYDYSTWKNSANIIAEKTKNDALVTLGNLYGIDNINRRMVDGTEDVIEELDDLLSKAIAFKFRSGMGGVFKYTADKLFEQNKNYFSTPQLQRLELSLRSVAKAIMDRFRDKYSQFDMSEDFINYVSDLDRNKDEVNRAYSIMHGLRNPEDGKQFERSFAKWIELLQSHSDDYLDYKKSLILDKVKDITPDVISYSRSKSRDIMNKKLDDKYYVEKDKGLSQFVDCQNNTNEEEFDSISMDYVRNCIKNGTAHGLVKGILSSDFIENHRREIMKLLVDSNYSDGEIYNIFDDIFNQDQFDEEM